MKGTKMLTILVLALGLMVWQVEVSEAEPMGTAFTYQGRLIDANGPADGLYDFQFKLYDSPADGNQFGSTIDVNELDVIEGYFTVELDFGSVFDGDARWLEIDVRPGDSNDANDFVTLSPRQEVTATPYALYAKSATGVAVPLELSGSAAVPNAVIKATNTGNGYGVYGQSTSGSGVYGKNSNSSNYGFISSSIYGVYGRSYSDGGSGVFGRSDSNFGYGVYGYNSSGYAGYFSGKAKVTGDLIVDANVGIGTTSPGEKLDVSGNININSVYKIGGDTILSNSGTNNIFVGVGAGENNSSGSANTFLGFDAGLFNTTGHSNTFLGFDAGLFNTTGNFNTFLGLQAGFSNTTGDYNTFLGWRAGRSNTTGGFNTFLGWMAGFSNTTSHNNTFLGNHAGYSNTTGNSNTFLGNQAGYSNTTGYHNTFLGRGAGQSNQTGGGNVFIGYQAGYNETGDDKLYIANSNTSTPLIYGDFSTGNVGIGTTSPGTYDVAADNLVVYDSNNSGITIASGGNYLGSIYFADRTSGLDKYRGFVQYRHGVLGERLRFGANGAEIMSLSNGSVGIGTTSPAGKLDVNGRVAIRDFYAAGANYDLRVRLDGGLTRLTSSQRYKKNIRGLEIDPETVCSLRPVRFNWKESGDEDVGLIAEEVDKVIDDLVIYDEQGKPDAVKYDKVALCLLTVVKAQQQTIAALEGRIEALERAVQPQLAKAKEVQQ